jgi:hypothetical protein
MNIIFFDLRFTAVTMKTRSSGLQRHIGRKENDLHGVTTWRTDFL